MTKRKIEKRVLLGLDIDGVLNPCRLMLYDEPEITKTSVYYLNRILEAIPNCDILITSCWGNVDDRTVKALCNQGFLYSERVVGATGIIYDTEYSRTKEIVHWMDKYTENFNNGLTNIKYIRHIFLDDEPILYAYFEEKYGVTKRHVVVTRADIGLDESKSYETICKLLGFNFRFW